MTFVPGTTFSGSGFRGRDGQPGRDGKAGQDGAQGPVGPSTVRWVGSWRFDKFYVVGDVVFYEGSAYICTVSVEGVPPSVSKYWDIFVMRGLGERGGVGPQGIQGPTGPQGDTVVGPRGFPGLVWEGDWDSGTAYAVGDGVAYLGSSYIAIQAGTNHTPADDDFWDILALKGDDGSGSGSAFTWMGAWDSMTTSSQRCSPRLCFWHEIIGLSLRDFIQ